MKQPKSKKKTPDSPPKKLAASKELPNSRVKLSFKRHVVPPLGGLFVFVLVFGFFNSDLLSARIAYSVNSRNLPAETAPVIVEPDPVTPLVKDPTAPSKITISSIGVDAPIVHDQTVVDEEAFQIALQRGVVHYPGTAKPGDIGNVVLFGHSSSPWWAKGDYKFVFTLLDKLELDDYISVDYEGITYVYQVNNILTVPPTDTSVLNQADSHMLTLITCSPVGSNTERLIVQAEQISPDTTPVPEIEVRVVTPEILEDEKLPGASSGFWRNFLNLF